MTQASHGPDRTDGGTGLYASAVGRGSTAIARPWLTPSLGDRARAQEEGAGGGVALTLARPTDGLDAPGSCRLISAHSTKRVAWTLRHDPALSQ